MNSILFARGRGVFVLLACLAVLFTTLPSQAQVGGGTGPMPRHFPHTAQTPPPSPAGPGKIRLTIPDGDRGPVVLVPKSGGFVGEFVVWNDGPGPLTVSRVAVRTDDDDPRLPPRFNARFADGGGGSSVVLPHSSKRVTITWTPEREPKLHQAIGHVVFTSNDEVAGEVAMGFVAPLGGGAGFLTGHLLTWLLLLPLLGAVAILGMHLVGYADEGRLRGIALWVTGLQCLLAIVLYEGFRGAVTRLDGNDGFQYIERSVLWGSAGVEYYVGVDGMSVSLVVLTALVGFTGAVASYSVKTDDGSALRAFYGFFLVLLTGVMGVFVSLDLALLAGFWLTMLIGLFALVAVSGSPLRRLATAKLAVYGGVSAASLVFAVGALHLHSDPTFLVDGTRTPHTFAIPELMRVAYNAKGLTLFGASWIKVVWGALFVGFGVLVPVVPLHRWFVGAVTEAPAPVAIVVAGVVLKTGVYGFLRVCVGILPDGSRWAAATLVALGVVNIAFGAVCALRQRDLRQVVAYAAVGQMGFCLVGLGAMTREGILGCLLQMSSHGLLVAILFVLVGALRERTKTSELASLRGLAGPMPLLATLTGFAFLAFAGVPGFSGFWGEVVPVLGAFPVQRSLAVCAASFAIVTAAATLRALHGVFLGPGEGGVFAELAPRELTAVTPLLVLSVALGVCPAPFFTLVQGGVSDENQLVNPPGPDEVALADDPSR